MFGTKPTRNDAPADRENNVPETQGRETDKDSDQRTTETGPASIDWFALVEQIKSGSQAGMEELYQLFSKGIRYYLQRQLGAQELEDKVHDTFLIVVNAIRRGDIREPDRLMGFVRTIVHRQVAQYIGEVVHSRRDETDMETGLPIPDRGRDPEQEFQLSERVGLMKTALAALSDRDREILVRYYLKEQPQEQICEELSLTDTQFRLLKSRAKAKFGEIGRKKLRTSEKVLETLRNRPTEAHSYAEK